MGAFNTLITEVSCGNCGRPYEGRIQFKFGNTWQFNYQIGDTLGWGGNDQGIAHLAKVKVWGTLESPDTCTYCGYPNPEEWDIFMENDVIKSVEAKENVDDYLAVNDDYITL
jgi:hypothetical protein